MLYNVDKTDVKIANSYIDKSISQINKIKIDIDSLNEKINKNNNTMNTRMNVAYKKLYNLEKSVRLNKLKDVNSKDKDVNSKDKDVNDNSITKIIRLDPSSKMPPFFPLLSGMIFNNNNNSDNKKSEKNELIDSEDEYNDDIDIYATIENNIENDIIEINININDIDDLINLGLKYKNEMPIKNNNDETQQNKKIKNIDDIAEEAFKKVFSDIINNKSKDSKLSIKFFNEKDSDSEKESVLDSSQNDKSNNKSDDKIKNYYVFNEKKYTLDINKIINLIEPLIKLKRIIGMEKVKKQIIDMILYYIQNFENTSSDMLHTSIEGPPGVGKTKLGRVLAQIYSALDIIPSKRFTRVRRTDLIGKYLGHTAHKTQEVIDEAEGGVLFIDEAYSLGDNENRDSFSKECIDTINQNLTEKKKNLIVIIAGYSDQLDKTFFALNEGLKRRFPFRFTIDGYNEKELTDIFYSKIKKINWRLNMDLDRTYLENFYKINKDKFKNYGGDIETLVMNCKMTHASRVIGKNYLHKKIIIKDDLEKAFERFINNKNKKEEMSTDVKNFYM